MARGAAVGAVTTWGGAVLGSVSVGRWAARWARIGPDTAEAARYRRSVPAALVATLVPMAVLACIVGGALDLHVYRTGGTAWLKGISLYAPEFGLLVPGGPLPFTYPPFAAIVFAPVSWLPWHVAKAVMCLVSAASIVLTALIVAGRRHGRGKVALATALGVSVLWFAFEPVRQTVSFGQINLILMVLVAADCLLPRTWWPRGVLVGVAAAVKLTPAVFVVFFLVRRQYRAAAVSVAAFAACGLLAFALAPGDSVEYWTSTLFDPSRIGGAAYAFNQNIQAILVRLLPAGPGRSLLWLVLAAAAMALAVVGARRAHRAGDPVTALLLIATGGLLASPVSWSHHWVWVLPAAVVAFDVARRGGTAVRAAAVLMAVVFAAGPHGFLPQTHDLELHWTWWQHLLGSSYVLIAVAVLIRLAVRPLAMPGTREESPAKEPDKLPG
ncbi:glycosyltransferase 87 family protein [Amycolatopsis cynarae]|uniref:Glycosyltransferase 87 family protein n=1 Tax=Amycolatopsis cynarae TaxID=2995223 RepID=A0ABY7AV92_9PSEU|nr:glycosyltransferase 87 family protein [Amycolatopsis sp. HUAS 11-8]WAL63902.1 glycosyltransferase 87 family protein [Amycolatopsis sp. HUAS 11-8]